MIDEPKVSDEQQRKLRYDFVTMIEQYDNQEALGEFRSEWDGTVNFKIVDDHTVIASVSGQEKLPRDLKERTWGMLEKFNKGHY